MARTPHASRSTLPPGTPALARSGSLVLVLPLTAWRIGGPDALDVAGLHLKRKRELHITLANSAVLDGIADEALALAQRRHWRPLRTGDAALIGDPDRAWRGSLVEWVELAGFHAFRRELGELRGTAVPHALPHITQYASDARGIGLPDLQTTARRRLAELRLPGLATRMPACSAASVRRSYADGRSVLPPDVTVRLRRRDPRIDAWLEAHAAKQAWIVSAADPLGAASPRAGNAVRWALLDAALQRDGIRSVEVCGQEDDGEPMRASLCLLDTDERDIDRFLLEYEQLAAVRVQAGRAPSLRLHPALRVEGGTP